MIIIQWKSFAVREKASKFFCLFVSTQSYASMWASLVYVFRWRKKKNIVRLYSCSSLYSSSSAVQLARDFAEFEPCTAHLWCGQSKWVFCKSVDVWTDCYMLQNISLWKAACDMHRTSPVVMCSVNTGHVMSGIAGASGSCFCHGRAWEPESRDHTWVRDCTCNIYLVYAQMHSHFSPRSSVA